MLAAAPLCMCVCVCVRVRVRKTLPTWGRELKLFNKWHDCNVCECVWLVCVRLHNSRAVFAFLRLFSLFLLLIK